MTDTESTTKSALLDAATAIFAEKGYPGASVREITAAARANLAAITYHFGSKAALFEAVMVRALSGLIQLIEGATTGPGSALDRIERIFSLHFTFLADHPHFRRLAGQVMLSEARIPDRVGAYLRRMVGTLMRLVVEGQKDGSIRPGDPRVLTVALMAPSIVVNMLRVPMKVGPGLDLDDPVTRESVRQELLTYLRAALSAREA